MRVTGYLSVGLYMVYLQTSGCDAEAVTEVVVENMVPTTVAWQTVGRVSANRSDAITSIAFSSDGGILGGTINDGTVLIWSVTNGQVVTSLRCKQTGLSNLSFSSDGNLVLASAVGKSYIWDVTSKDPQYVWKCSQPQFSDIRGIVIGRTKDEPGVLYRAYSTDNGKEVSLPASVLLSYMPSNGIYCLGPEDLQCGFAVVGCDKNDSLTVIRRGDKSVVGNVKAAGSWAWVSSDGTLLATGSGGQSVCIWDVLQGKKLWTSELADDLNFEGFSPDNRTAILRISGVLSIRKAHSGVVERSVRNRSGGLGGFAWSSKGEYFAVVSAERFVVIYKTLETTGHKEKLPSNKVFGQLDSKD